MSRRGSAWSFAEIKRLGNTPDSVLARRSRRTIKEIVAMREHYRIAMETGPRPWTMREIKLLGRMNDYELARRLRAQTSSLAAKSRFQARPIQASAPCRKWEPSEIKLLGTMRDAVLAPNWAEQNRPLNCIERAAISPPLIRFAADGLHRRCSAGHDAGRGGRQMTGHRYRAFYRDGTTRKSRYQCGRNFGRQLRTS